MLGVPCFSIACTFLFCIYIYSVTEVYVFPGHKLRLSYSCRTEDVKQNGILILSLKYPTCVLIVCRLFKIISSLQSTSYKNSAGVFKVLITSASINFGRVHQSFGRTLNLSFTFFLDTVFLQHSDISQ